MKKIKKNINFKNFDQVFKIYVERINCFAVGLIIQPHKLKPL